MKVVFLARYLPAEGSTVQMYSLATGLIERNNEVHVLSAGPGEDVAAKKLFSHSEEGGVQHQRVGFPLRPSFSPIGKLIQLFTYFTALPRALWLLFRIRPDIVHVHYPVTSFIAKIFGLITHTPFVVTHHTMGIPRHPLNWRGDAAIAISSDLERDLVERVGYSPVAVHRVFNGVDTDRFQPPSAQDRAAARAMLGLPSDEMLILFVGSIEHHKGLDVLLDALSRCEVPRPRAVIMGDGDDAWLRRETLTHGVEDSVIRLPFSDPLSAYQAADMFVLPSRREGFPLVSVEAMACGLPVIRSNTGGATDQIDHGETGLLFPSEDANALHACIQQLGNDSDLREVLGAAAARKARSLFSRDAMTEATLGVYGLAR